MFFHISVSYTHEHRDIKMAAEEILEIYCTRGKKGRSGFIMQDVIPPSPQQPILNTTTTFNAVWHQAKIIFHIMPWFYLAYLFILNYVNVFGLYFELLWIKTSIK